VKSINALAIWNTVFAIGAINTFALFSDNDDTFANGTTGALLDATPLAFPGNPVPAQVFSFEPTATRFVHINALNTNNPPDLYGLGEVAFSATSPVPEPATLALVAAGIAGIWLAQKRSR